MEVNLNKPFAAPAQKPYVQNIKKIVKQDKLSVA